MDVCVYMLERWGGGGGGEGGRGKGGCVCTTGNRLLLSS